MAKQDLSYCLFTTSISLSTGGRLLVQVIVETAKVYFYTCLRLCELGTTLFLQKIKESVSVSINISLVCMNEVFLMF